MARDVSIQLDGIAIVYWGTGQAITNYGHVIQFIRNLNDMPMRIVSRHLCYQSNSDAIKIALPLIAQVHHVWDIVRTVIHRGSAMECLYNMLTY